MKQTLIIITALMLVVGISNAQTYKGMRFNDDGSKSFETYKESKGKLKLVKKVSWYSNGQKESEDTYKDGKLIKRNEWDRDGNVIEQLTSSDEETSSINSTPESVMVTIISAAKTGKVGVLKSLLPPEGEGTTDGDCKALCNPGNKRMRNELGHNYVTLEEFKKYFSKAKIVGEPIINGDQAEVNFVFGPNVERDETMNLQRIKGKWYLKSF